jgi:hypothetical protein
MLSHVLTLIALKIVKQVETDIPSNTNELHDTANLTNSAVTKTVSSISDIPTVDSDLLQQMYDYITTAQAPGVSFLQICEKFPQEDETELEYLVGQLLNFEFVYRIHGYNTHYLVADAFISKYQLALPEDQMEKEQFISPWITINGKLNSSFILKAKQKLLSMIIKNPGISQVRIPKLF